VQRILEPGQIEALAESAVPRIRLPDRAQVFELRARRLRQLAEGHAIGDYLRLLAVLADAQHAALATMDASVPDAEQRLLAHTHGMPVAPAASWQRDPRWRALPTRLCAAVAATAGLPPGVRDLCERLRQWTDDQFETQADALLGARTDGVDAAAAPFVMGALQVYWVALASSLASGRVDELGARGVCPVCGTLPVASVVHADRRSQGYRYLHCALCATEWHMVRVTCSQCESTKGISYQSIEGAPDAVRAECCDGCRTYRKILYQEKDAGVEPVADDLASLALDLLLTEAGYHRGSGNPLLWQP
jgi:FdhE protein